VTPISVGNDVVDLRQPAAKHSAANPRFLDRVFTDRECDAIAAAPDRMAMLWTLFGAKEAGYKVVNKLRPAAAFAHNRFEVSADLSELFYDDIYLRLSIDRTDDRVHVVACTLVGVHMAGVGSVPPGADPSAAVRDLLKAAVASRVGCAAGDLAVVREKSPGSWDGFGPPRLLLRGRPAEIDVSLSHDGRFVAFAAAGAMLSAAEG